jgi:hypothetical protein
MFIEHIKSDANGLRQPLEGFDYRVLISRNDFLAIHGTDPGLANIKVKS